MRRKAMDPTADPADSIFDFIERWERQPGRPFVTLTYAQSLDGSLAARRGEPLGLSGIESQRLTHQLRANHSAILIGIGTLLADNPRLNVRLVPGKDPQPVILDSRLRTPPGAQVFHATPPWIATTQPVDPGQAADLERRGARLLVFQPVENGRIPLASLLERLDDLGVHRLMVEGGAAVITAFLRARLVDLVVLTVAPILVGGQPAVEDRLGEGAGSFPRLTACECAHLGEDLVVWGTPSWPAGL